ncbi:hypothetical protein [Halomonas sp. SpR8]|uniref:hypothetical protein n=1 Tax=Halomonas sp. SpR8 TaxID=3050463 RepID=UPI0027E53E73|nr:hypothetical protein [Halomonas sp. SpR8]MDQ7729953.1 hypothetical protein [Halomonas sp. SpR8]
MSNKLVPVIIDNPSHKSWGYRTRDILITLATLVLWLLVMSRLYMFFIAEEAVLEKLYSSVMIKVVLVGFVVTFLMFHFWAVYNRFLYTSHLKRQMLHDQQPTHSVDYKVNNEIESTMESQIERAQMHEHQRAGKPSQAAN